MIYYVTVCFKHSNLEIKVEYTEIQFSPIFFSKKEEYYNRAQADFDFGQVHVVWWLSYGQVEEKISVEPWLHTSIEAYVLTYVFSINKVSPRGCWSKLYCLQYGCNMLVSTNNQSINQSTLASLTLCAENPFTEFSWWRHQMETHFRVTGPLYGEFPGYRLIPRTKGSDAELWCFLWSAFE